ncbi:MAG: hypothetical protein EOP04_22480 [Proteobacteria bacterium]|nr:MAG: hypothetical protein EOP04_22480 [Pseudomonadota bacterium]
MSGKSMHTAHRIEIAPNNKQRTYFSKASGTARFAYNWALREWKNEYEDGQKPTEAKLRKKLNARKKSEFPWMCPKSLKTLPRRQ